MSKRKIFLSVIIPVFNEEKTVQKILTKVLSHLPPSSEVIVVNDGSSDKTQKKLKYFKKEKRVRIFTLAINRGKGYAVRYGMKRAKGDVFLIQDADLEYNPEDYKRILQPIKSGNTQVIYGSRLANYPFSLTTLRTIPLPLHYIANKLLTFLTNLLYGSHLTDMETCYKAFTRNVYKKLELRKNSFDIEAEITAKILRSGFNIIETPIETKPRSYDEGKKITFKHGVTAVITLIQFRLDAFFISCLAVVATAAFFRFWNFQNRYGLWSDQARDAIVGRISIAHRTIPLIGSFSSAGPFTFGPYWYWHSIMMNLLFKSHFGYWIGMGVASVVMVVVLMWIARQIGTRFMSIVVGVLAAISLAILQSSLGSTQHSMVGVITTLFLAAVVLYLKNPKSSTLFVVGFLLSFSMNFHYQTVYLLPMVVILLLVKRPKLKGVFYVLLGLFIPFIPLIIFDFQHHWWNLTKVIDYLRFGQYRIYVPNRWLTYAGLFWPSYWTKVVGGYRTITYISMGLIGLLFLTKLVTNKLKKEVLVFGFGFLFAIIGYRYYRGERMEGYIVYSQPFILLFSAWLVEQIKSFRTILGYVTLLILVTGSVLILRNDLSYQNSYNSLSQMKNYLYETLDETAFALYDQEFRTSGCSISLSLLMDDDNKSKSQGAKLGMCQGSYCPPYYKVITQAETGGMLCKIVDLREVSSKIIKDQNWVLVSPEEVHRMTVEWWKDEENL